MQKRNHPRNRVSFRHITVIFRIQTRNPVSKPPQTTPRNPRNRVSAVDIKSYLWHPKKKPGFSAPAQIVGSGYWQRIDGGYWQRIDNGYWQRIDNGYWQRIDNGYWQRIDNGYWQRIDNG
jgi:hypothetical protein